MVDTVPEETENCVWFWAFAFPWLAVTKIEYWPWMALEARVKLSV